MSNIKLSGHTWDTSGSYDVALEKTQDTINADVDKIDNWLIISKYYTDLWENGGITSSIGSNTTVTNRIRTKDFISDSFREVVPENGYKIGIFVYDKSTSAFLGFWNGTSVAASSGSTVLWLTSSVLLPTGYKLRISAGLVGDDDTDTQIADKFIFTSITDDSLTIGGKAADAKVTGDKLSSLENTFDCIKKAMTSAIPFTIVASGYVVVADGSISGSSASSYTNYVDVSNFSSISYKQQGTTGATSPSGMVFYDSSKAFISDSGRAAATGQASSGYLSELSRIDVPNNAKYARFTTYTNIETYGAFELYGIINVVKALSSLSE